MRPKQVLIVLITLWAAAAAAQVPNEALRCLEPTELLQRDQYLKALSLDIRGTLPSADELEAAAPEAALESATLDAWLASGAFAEQASRHHRSLLWSNVSNLNLLTASAGLNAIPRAGFGFEDAPTTYYRRNRANPYRGGVVPCLNEPARFAEDGSILTTLQDDGTRREGWVEVSPYWAPDTTLRICAFDGNPTLITAGGRECGTRAGIGDINCGCGPELRWCQLGARHRAVSESMTEAFEQVVQHVMREDRPYTDLFSTRRAWVNGPLVYFYRHQTGVTRFTFTPSPVDPAVLPDLDWTDRDTWVEIELGEAHAGLLTRPAFLLRFQTNFSRANRFFNAFLCQPFQPPAGGIPLAEQNNPDLQERAGCKYCHALLGPSAAHWGRWTEQGAGYLSAEDFTPYRESCEICARSGQGCSAECRAFYVTTTYSEAEEPFIGMLKEYYFRRDVHVPHVEVGPRLLAWTGIADNRLPTCVAEKTAEWLLGRPMDAEGDAAWLAELARTFVAGDYRFRSLVRAIVTDDRYRRVH